MGEESILFIGSLNREAPSFKRAKGKGIAAYRFDLDSGEATLAGETAGIDNPSYLTVHPSNGCLYATSEVFGWNEGTVTAYRFDRASGRLIYLNKQPTLGSMPAYCSIDRTGRFLLVANYAIGPLDDLPGKSVAVLPIRGDGGVDPAAASAAHTGSGPNRARQERSHAHCIMASPDNRTVVVADLGIDSLVSYRFDAKTGTITLRPASLPVLVPGISPSTRTEPKPSSSTSSTRPSTRSLTMLPRGASRSSIPSRRFPMAITWRAIVPASRSARTGASSTGPIAATTASSSTKSTRRAAS